MIQMTDRGVSTTLSYVLTLAIAAILVAGLILAGSSFVEDRREQVIRQELRVIGEHLASNVEQVDRFARASDELTEARIEQTFPTDVTGSSYSVKLVENGGDPELRLNASRPQVSVDVNVTVENDVATETVASGGTIAVECVVPSPPGSCDELEIDNG